MKNIITIVTIILATFFISCDDDDNIPSIVGKWNYKSPHVIFEYTGDTIKIATMENRYMAISSDNVTNMLTGMIAQYAGMYFSSIDFGTNKDIYLNVKMGPVEQAINATFEQSADIIQVVSDTNTFKLISENIPSIPLSFKYRVNAKEMTVFFSKIYLEMIVYMMTDQLIDMLIPMITEGITEGIPEQIKPMVILKIKASLTEQIPVLLDNITEMEIGVNLARE